MTQWTQHRRRRPPRSQKRRLRYIKAGELPPKRHIQFRRPDGGLYAEELFSTKGFDSAYSLLYHLRPPTATLDVRPWRRAAVELQPNEPLRNRHFKTQTLAAGADAIEARTPVLGNTDVLISVSETAAPMNYFYRNVGGDELLFIHRGEGTLQTPFGDLAYLPHDYLSASHRQRRTKRRRAPTRMLHHSKS